MDKLIKKKQKKTNKLPTVIQPLQVNTDTYGHATSTIHCDHTLKRKHTGKVSYIGFCCTFYLKKKKKPKQTSDYLREICQTPVQNEV